MESAVFPPLVWKARSKAVLAFGFLRGRRHDSPPANLIHAYVFIRVSWPAEVVALHRMCLRGKALRNPFLLRVE